MRVFVAGASGAIGRPLVRKLLDAGHQVTGMTRSEERAEALRAAGAEAVVADALDAEAVRDAIVAAAPEALVHQLTDLPSEWQMRQQLGQTSRLRTEGTRNLLDGAAAAGARRFVAQSIAFIYSPKAPPAADEDAPTVAGTPGFGEAVDAVLELEHQVTTAEGIDGLALRYGFFYGPGTWFARGTKLAREIERRRYPIVGKGEGLFSFIHVDDAAEATIRALEEGAPGVYNVVDDDPGQMREWLPVLADALGAKPPRRVPVWLARLFGGEQVSFAVAMRGASNEKAKRELGWRPRYASWRVGFREAIG
ncbi:MAG TPA: NAD(P)-dependent oxidoreductase [Thermoleophilaceae bacterium]|nr:NAD(P)-dependent oxidoreductase [Thermoleophilaceae bacterium]